MADDPERDVFPTKEVKYHNLTSGVTENVAEKRSVPHLSRTDLEDQFYKFKEENFQLKKAAKKQEDDLKKLATKMSRLLREKKSLETMNSPSHKRDLELEEMVEDLQDKVRQLEKTNSHLREKMLVAKQQVIMQVRRPYSHVAPKVNSGNTARSVIMPYTSSINLRGKSNQNLTRKVGNSPIPQYAINLLEEARHELSNLKMLISSQKTEIEQYEHENEILKQKLRMKDIEFEDELNSLKSQLIQHQRQHVQENLDLIRLHRELKQKNANYLALQTQCSDMEEKFKMLKMKHDHLVKEVDDLATHLKAEQKKNLELLGELQKAQLLVSTVSELQGRITVLEKENTFLREANEKFIKNALDIDQRTYALEDRKRLHTEETLKEKISSLESSLEIQSKEKVAVQEELSKVKEAKEFKEKDYVRLKENFDLLESQVAELKTEVDIIKSYDVEINDLEEAVNLLKLKRENKLNLNDKTQEVVEVTNSSGNLESKKEPEEEPEKVLSDVTPGPSLEELESLKSQLEKIKEEQSETLKELSHVQELLNNQCSISQASQEEIKLLTQKTEQQEKEFQAKIQEYLHLLDLRNARIQKLEKQLNDIAYGTQTFQTSLPDSVGKSFQTVELSNGENIFEIHVVKVNLTSEGMVKFQSPNPNIFLTWNFYEYELQSTPVVSAKRPTFNYTAQYIIQVDDYFLCYLLEKTIRLELHESLGVDFKTFAACQLSFSDLLSKSCDKIHGVQNLIGLEENSNINFGSVEFWIQLQIPMDEAFKYFKEKLKALKYIHSNKKKSAAAMSLLEQPINKETCINDLHVKIIRAMNLKSSQKDVQPSTFCIYKFFDLPDQDTVIVPASNNPEYSDHRTFSIFINSEVEKYLRTEELYVYVFDDNELDIASHIGRAAIPLEPLLQNKPIKGNFELQKDGKSGYGFIEVLIYWQFEYSPVLTYESFSYEVHKEQTIISPSPTTPSHHDETVSNPPFVDISPVQPPVPKPRKSIPSRILTSTPLSKDSYQSSSEEGSNSPKISPVNSHSNSFSVLQESAKQSSRSSGAGNELKAVAEIHSPTNGSIIQNEASLTRKISLSSESSDDDKLTYSDESEESEKETDADPFEKQEYSMVVCVHHLMLRSDAAVLQDASVKMLYVEYRFLDYPLEELETPFSLPKVASPNLIQYNFEKIFTFKPSDVERWNSLAKMIFSDVPECSLIKFTVVSDPSDEQDLDCEDIGYGSVDLKQVLLNQADKIQEDIKIYDATDTSIEIGQLNITIEALDILEKLNEIVET